MWAQGFKPMKTWRRLPGKELSSEASTTNSKGITRNVILEFALAYIIEERKSMARIFHDYYMLQRKKIYIHAYDT